MKLENIYGTLAIAKNAIDNDSAHGAEHIITELMASIKAEIITQNAKASGKGTQLKAAQRILKAAEKQLKNCLKYAPIIDGKQYICDGFRIIRLEPDSFLELPAMPDDMEYVDVKRFFPAFPYDIELELPDIKALKTYIKIEKETHKGERGYRIPFDFGAGLPMVDATLLLDILELLPDSIARVNKVKGDTNLNMIRFDDPRGNSAILCPIRPGVKVERKRTEV